ncbi:NUDIX domain-containing protein [Purpureocillium lavendulum]|uniref:NUDIX domain-containing protein n=1 Tax=Purpureocillium lavendulum TaxID=1247861 RepID=A0AB34FRY4_9HYPO|nr:NUDIX domain-containing protein [Purpureocillium lavendulum]
MAAPAQAAAAAAAAAAAHDFTVDAAVPACLSLPPREFLAARPHIHRLMAACMVFRRAEQHASTDNNNTNNATTTSDNRGRKQEERQGPVLQALLIRRAAADSYSLKWEIPGGSVSLARDASVLAAAARELREETGLRVARVRRPLGMLMHSSPSPLSCAPGDRDVDGTEDKAGEEQQEQEQAQEQERTLLLVEPPPGLGISPAEEQARQDPADDALTVTFLETGRRWGKVALLVDVREAVEGIPSRGRIGFTGGDDKEDGEGDRGGLGRKGGQAGQGAAAPTIVMDPREHEEWAWLTEEQVRRGVDAAGRPMEYTSAGVWRGVLAGFAARRALEGDDTPS